MEAGPRKRRAEKVVAEPARRDWATEEVKEKSSWEKEGQAKSGEATEDWAREGKAGLGKETRPQKENTGNAETRPGKKTARSETMRLWKGRPVWEREIWAGKVETGDQGGETEVKKKTQASGKKVGMEGTCPVVGSPRKRGSGKEGEATKRGWARSSPPAAPAPAVQDRQRQEPMIS